MVVHVFIYTVLSKHEVCLFIINANNKWLLQLEDKKGFFKILNCRYGIRCGMVGKILDPAPRTMSKSNWIRHRQQ